MIFGKKQIIEQEPGALLLLQVPRTNEKKELAAEQMFASLHGLLTAAEKRRFSVALHERVSFEIAVQHKRIGFYVWVPEHLESFVEEQVYAQYPEVQITKVDDYTQSSAVPASSQAVTELKFIANQALPIKTFPSFEVDPLAAITAALAQFEDGEEAWLQFILKPANENWHKKSEHYAAGIRGGKSGTKGMINALWAPPETKSETPKLAEHETARAAAAEAKSHKLAYETAVRIVYRGNTTPTQAKMRLQAITASFKQFNTTYLNGFTQKYLGDDLGAVELYTSRSFGRGGFICNIEEVASLYHLPHTNVETPNILWANAKTAEPPANLPLVNEANRDMISPIAVTNFRGHNTMFGLARADRGRHLYIIGQTGVGKSGMLELLTISDIYSPYGFAVIDPHGDYAMNILKRIPEERAQDVLYFNPADTDFPIAFNPMEVYDSKLKTHTTSELIGVLKRMFESWGPRLEYILRYSLLALLDYPQATMLDITRILTDKKFRTEVLSYVEDPVVRNFWLVEFASWNERFAAEAVSPVLNKVGAFTANPIVRNIIGQPKSSFNIRQIMDERKILIVNLSRGLIGEDNAALLGSLLVTKIQMAAMSRADIDLSERTPFYLYVDEFQNFATESFATILSEARKYGLNLTVANQYIAQMSMEVKDAVFGNVGSIVSFRAGADDARIMLRYFEPKFEEHDMVHMHNRHFVISMTIEGEKVQAFSATTLDLPPATTDFSAQIIQHSRESFAFDKAKIEEYVRGRYVPSPQKQNIASQSPTQAVPKEKPSAAPTKPKKDAVTMMKNIGATVAKIIEPASPSTAVKTPIKAPASPPHISAVETETATEPKRKRKRSRSRRKKNDESTTGHTEISVSESTSHHTPRQHTSKPEQRHSTPSHLAMNHSDKPKSKTDSDQPSPKPQPVTTKTDGEILDDTVIHLR